MKSALVLIDRLSAASGVLAGWLVAPLILAMCYEVAARYLFGAPTIWAYEISYMLTGAIFLLGMAYTLAQGQHIRIDIAFARMRPRIQALVDLAGYLLLLLPFVVWLSYAFYGRAWAAMTTGEKTGQSAWNPPIWPFRAMFFVAFVLLGLQILREVSRALGVLIGPPASADRDRA